MPAVGPALEELVDIALHVHGELRAAGLVVVASDAPGATRSAPNTNPADEALSAIVSLQLGAWPGPVYIALGGAVWGLAGSERSEKTLESPAKRSTLKVSDGRRPDIRSLTSFFETLSG